MPKTNETGPMKVTFIVEISREEGFDDEIEISVESIEPEPQNCDHCHEFLEATEPPSPKLCDHCWLEEDIHELGAEYWLGLMDFKPKVEGFYTFEGTLSCYRTDGDWGAEYETEFNVTGESFEPLPEEDPPKISN